MKIDEKINEIESLAAMVVKIKELRELIKHLESKRFTMLSKIIMGSNESSMGQNRDSAVHVPGYLSSDIKHLIIKELRNTLEVYENSLIE